MEIKAESNSVRISPRKARLVAEMVRGLSVERALTTLELAEKRAGRILQGTIKSAIANAIHNAKLNKDALYVKYIEVTEGPALKRFHPSTRGRVHPYKKRSSHIRITIEERSNFKSKAVVVAK